MLISVIIATYNRCELLKRTLPLLLQQDLPSSDYEVIVVVDGSTDGTTEYVRTLKTLANLRVIQQENLGQAAAINAGIRAARSYLLLFLDDDIVCGPTLLSQHVNAQRVDKQCLAFGPVIVSPDGPDPLAIEWAQSFCDDFFETKVHKAPEQGWYGCMASANSSLPRSIMLTTGGLDESFTRGNDIEIGFRLLEAGYTFSYLPSATVTQIFQKTRSEVIEDAGAEGAAEVRLCRKFPALRKTSRFGTMSSRPWWKRAITRILATAPYSVEPLLRPFTDVLASLRRIPSCKRWAHRLFQQQQTIVASRGAVKEAGSWRALEREFGSRLPVLMYHGIGPLRTGPGSDLTVSPQMFESQLKWLTRNGFSTIHVADWVAHQRDGKALPSKPILLTFDDAYRETAEYGFPLLEKYGFTGTLFLVSSQIGGTNAWDRPAGIPQQPLMNAEEIRHWADKGIEIGSHTITHPDLRTLNSEETRIEMEESRDYLMQLLGKPVSVFAYPYGYFTDQTIEVARELYDAALTCDLGINRFGTDPMRIRRAIVVPRFTWFAMRTSVLFGFNMHLLLRIKFHQFAHLVLDPFLKRKPASDSDESH